MKYQYVIQLAIGFLVGAAATLSLWAGLFSGLELFLEDLLVSQKPLRDDIVLVAIDDQSLKKIGQWPWPRAVFAWAFRELSRSSPAAVALDVMMSEHSRLGTTDDAALRDAIADAPFPVVMPAEAGRLTLQNRGPLRADSFLLPLKEFTEAPGADIGHVNLVTDADGITRRFPGSVAGADSGAAYAPFAETVVRRSGKAPRVPLAPDRIHRIVFSAPPGAIRRIPFWRIYEGNAPDDLAGKIIFIGATAPDLHDERITPFSRGNTMPGAEIHAQIATMLLQGYRLNPLPGRLQTLWIFSASFIPALLFILFKKSRAALGANILIGFIQFGGIAILFDRGIAVNVVHGSGAWALSTLALFGYRYFSGERQRREMRRAFSRYVSRDVLAEILKDPSKIALGGAERNVTVFFSDIRGFTALSERTSPAELVALLNRYFTQMSEEVLRANGVLDKYIGDAIMAFWGAPTSDPDHAEHAVDAARGMIKQLALLNAEFRREGKPEISIGIGIYTGTAIVGNVGSDQRFDYTVIGDTVNAASRLEGLNKQYGTTIIIGESTRRNLKKTYDIRPLGDAEVKGRTEPIHIYEVCG